MKRTITNRFNVALMLVIASLFSVPSLAQDGKSVNVNITKSSESSSFIASPWMWVIGGAVFVLLLVALLRGRRNS